MNNDQFRKRGHELVDWLADYYDSIEDHPVLAQVEPGWVRAQLPESPPQEGESFDDIVADLERIILPGVTHWQSPNFFAYFPANASGPSVLGELLSAGLGVQGMLWATSPACTELETHMLDWLVEACGLPERFSSTGAGGGVIQDSASSAVLCALLAARERAGGVATLPRLVVYASEHAHSSVEKGARVAGLSDERVRKIRADDAHALDALALESAVAADAAAGLIPMAVIATAGTTSSTAFDPVADIADVCADNGGVWLHVDGAFAGSAAVCPELRFVNAGLERVDSYAFNPHKWLLTNFDCSAFYVADRTPLIDALSILPEYLRNEATESGAVIDYRDWQVPLGRRFRALKLWFVLRSYGVEGLRSFIRGHLELAEWFAAEVDDHPDFEVVAPAPLSLVCFRHTGGDEVNQAILATINGSGDAYLTHTVLDGRYTLRLAIGSVRTERRHVDAVWRAIQAAARRIC